VLQDIRIIHIPSSGTTQYIKHAWIAHLNDICIGHIYLIREANKKIKFLDAWVHKNYRRQGIFRKLWDVRWKYVNKNFKNYTVYAWAKPMSLPLLIEKGFNQGDTCVYVEKQI
jgi:GNAT superfamily N-acetyltransferase